MQGRRIFLASWKRIGLGFVGSGFRRRSEGSFSPSRVSQPTREWRGFRMTAFLRSFAPRSARPAGFSKWLLPIYLVTPALVPVAVQFNPMDAAIAFGARIVVTLFFIGLAGSSVVVILSFVEDFAELFHSKEEES